MTWIIKAANSIASADDKAAWTEAAGQALGLVAPEAHPFLVACLASRIAELRADNGKQADRLQNYCARLLRLPSA